MRAVGRFALATLAGSIGVQATQLPVLQRAEAAHAAVQPQGQRVAREPRAGHKVRRAVDHELHRTA